MFSSVPRIKNTTAYVYTYYIKVFFFNELTFFFLKCYINTGLNLDFSHVNQNISITKKNPIKQTKTHQAKLKGLNSEQHG